MADEDRKDEKPPAKAEHEPPAGAETTATWTTTGVSIDYTASAEWIVLRKKEKPAAEIFSVSYVADRDGDRPVTFVFNGGPGASSAYLHMGAVGPSRVAFPADGTLPRLPPRLVSNDESWLAFTDLVFVDPVATGFSRVIEEDGKDGEDKKKQETGDGGEAREYFGYKRDLESLCEFMGRWLSGQGRWGSAGVDRRRELWRISRRPACAHVAGDGGYRAQRRGAHLTGARVRIAVADRLRRARLGRPRADDGDLRGAPPALAGVLRRHALEDVLQDAERFATGDYATLLTRGASMPAAQRDGILGRLADLIGLPADMVARAEGRISIGTFTRELLRDERKVLGFYDATITATDPFPDRESFAGPDPTLAGIGPAYTTAINRQLRSEIGVETDREYVVLSEEVNELWRNDAPEHFFIAAGRRHRRLPLRHVAQPAHEGVHHARPLRPRDAVLRQRPAAEPDAPRPGGGRPADRPPFRRRPHVLRLGGEQARLHRRDRRVCRRRDGADVDSVSEGHAVSNRARLMELRRHLLTAEMLEPGTDRVIRTLIDVRVDPLTGHGSRILPERGLMPANDFDLAAFARENQPRCPFCPGRINSLTPTLLPAIDPDGRIVRGEAILFPNLHAYSSHSCVSVYSPRLHYLPLEDMTEQLVTDNLLTQVAYTRAVMAADPESRWASINANHMLPSGSSLFHPHLQGIVDPQPTTMQRMLAGAPAARFESYLRAERQAGERYLGNTGRIEWVVSFAPIAPAELRAFINARIAGGARR